MRTTDNRARIYRTDFDRLIEWLNAVEAHGETEEWAVPLPKGAAGLVRDIRDRCLSEAASLDDAANEVASELTAQVIRGTADRLRRVATTRQ